MSDAHAMLTWLSGPGPAALPPTTALRVRQSLLDTVAVAWAARHAGGMPAVSALAAADGGAPRSLLWDGSGLRVPPAAAAFHNSAFAAALDFDSLHAHASHIDAVVIPAAIAVAEHVHADGTALVAAIAAGNELAYRLARAGQARRGWFRTSVYGVFGAAAASARLLGLDADQTLSALGLALGQACGTQQGHLERTLSKRLLTGFAARAGVHSALLAQRGISGPRHAFDGEHGLFALTGDVPPSAPNRLADGAHPGGSTVPRPDAAALSAGLGQTWLIDATHYKPYPACGRAHAALQAALQLASAHPGGRFPDTDIAAVEVTLTHDMHGLVGGPYDTAGEAEVTGQFCAQYIVAAALRAGRFGLAQIAPAAVLDPSLKGLIDRTRIHVAGTGAFAPATVTVHLADAGKRSATVTAVAGGSAFPLDTEALLHKAADALAGIGLPPHVIERLSSRLLAIETLNDVAALFTDLSFPSHS